jgi:hypothetical protein
LGSTDGSRWFWPIVVVGTLAIWLGEWAIAELTTFRLPLAAILATQWLIAGALGALWYRGDPSLLAAASIALPIGALWTANILLPLPRLAQVAIYGAGLGLFFALASSDALTAWWYRVILRSRRVPPIR